MIDGGVAGILFIFSYLPLEPQLRLLSLLFELFDLLSCLQPTSFRKLSHTSLVSISSHVGAYNHGEYTRNWQECYEPVTGNCRPDSMTLDKPSPYSAVFLSSSFYCLLSFANSFLLFKARGQRSVHH